MRDQLRQLAGVDLDDFPGARVTGEIPITAAALNRLLARQLPESSPVAAVAIEPLEGDEALAHVRLRLSLAPPIVVRLRIVQQPQLPHAPVLVLHWAMSGLGPLSGLAGRVVERLASLPPGVRLSGDLLTVDVGELLQSRGFGDVLPRLTMLRLGTAPGRVIVHFELRNSLERTAASA